MATPDVRLDERQTRDLIEYALKGARAPMMDGLGMSTRGYDRADKIADGIARGIRNGLEELGLIERCEVCGRSSDDTPVCDDCMAKAE